MDRLASREASEFIKQKINNVPTIGLILASGLGVLADEIENPTIIPYQDIPHFPQSTVAGHKGGTNPLIGKNDDKLGARFPDMSESYNKAYIGHAEDAAKALILKVQKGVYVGNTGPSYETPAEVRMLGGDAVGMSTVPEVIVANHAGLRVLGISCISNMTAGILDQPLTHSEVMETTDKVRGNFLAFVKKIIETIPTNIK
ncbi:hypothetical protein [Oceanobacillus bengalensis]|uniref:purine-nucleoside phosphorylase n=1 Tax=Oceanobacillus bengalensis TaxID=1435466 RepID=A0A494Z129_9BACI|nr:hypothetical protein [Oceanobacillus bengalensis]RKQ16088.1 hypothetical protein D8M05_08285 [Oceanobacillus bengalensis]